MFYHIKRRKTLLKEDDAQPQQQGAAETSAAAPKADPAKIKQINDQIVQINAQIQRAQEDYNNRVENLNRQKVQLQQQLVNAGGSLQTDEAFRPKHSSFSRNLYESIQLSKAELLAAIIKNTFRNLGDVSYTLPDTSSLRLARRIINYLNSQNWNDGKNHWDDVEGNIREFLSRGNISFSRREIDDFVRMLAEAMKQEDTFSWIFGNERYM